jgi:alpha/beta hydrolase family protein
MLHERDCRNVRNKELANAFPIEWQERPRNRKAVQAQHIAATHLAGSRALWPRVNGLTLAEIKMSFVKTRDGVEIFYKDWGKGQPIVFSHGWPLSADDWDTQMLFFVEHGYRVIAHDRRGHGRSTQVGEGHDMDHYADDLAAVTAHLDLKNAIHVGHSTGGGEVVTTSHDTARAGLPGPPCFPRCPL